MFGKNASEVFIDLDDIVNEVYSRTRLEAWERDIKGAIRKDLHLEKWEAETVEDEFLRRYIYASEEVIRKLLFEIKWCKKALNKRQDVSKR